MATCTVSGLLKDITETGVANATIRANIVTPTFVTTFQLVPYEVSTTSDTNGAWSLTLSQGASVVITIDYPPNSTNSKKRLTYAIAVPATSTANFSTLATEL